MKKGRYQKKLYIIFIAIALCFILLFGSLTGWIIISSQREGYNKILQHTITTKYDSVQVVLDTITTSVSELIMAQSAQNWAASDLGPAYYHNAIYLFKDLNRTLANISKIDYDISVTRDDNESFVVTALGSVNKEDYFQIDQSGITFEKWTEILKELDNEATAVYYPVYNQNTLKSLYYIRKVEIKNKNTLILLTNIPATTLFGTDLNQEYLAFQKNKVLVYSCINEAEKASLDESFKYLLSKKHNESENGYLQYSFKSKELFVLNQKELPLSIVYQYDYSALMFDALMCILVILAGYAIIAFLAAMILAKYLYNPIHEVLENVPIVFSKEQALDEFKVIKQNVGTVSLLNEQLENVIKENDALLTRRYYRELLYAVPDLNCPLTAEQMSAGYCVALVEFLLEDNAQSQDDWYLQLQKNYLYVYTQELQPQCNVYCVSTDSHFCAIILQAKSMKEAEAVVEKFFDISAITCNMRIALSDIKEYVIHIQDCYRQALYLIECKYMMPAVRLITSEKLSMPDNSNFYYPMSMETHLIQSMATGNPNAISLFNSILDENLVKRTLGLHQRRNLIFALISTLMRAFDELKTTPESLLGINIDFEWLYANNTDVKVIPTLRDTVQQFVIAVQKRHQNSDDELLKKMLEYIYQNYSDDIMLNDIAQHCNISASYSSTLFKRLSCDNFKTFLNRYRIQRACEFLENEPNIKITDLSEKVGFNSSNSFIRVFQRYVGSSPKTYADSRCKKTKQ